MLTLTGRVTRIQTRDVTPVSSEPFTETTYVVSVMGATYYVTRSKNFGADLVEGQEVTVEVSIRAYVKRDGGAGYGLTGLRLVENGKRALASA